MNESDGKTPFRTTFLFVKNTHIVGMVAVEPIRQAYPLMLPTLERSRSSVQAIMGVHTIWVLGKYRGQNVASQLLDVARANFLYGTPSLSSEQVAFSSPTESGIAFARRYIHKSGGLKAKARILVYDCS